MVNFQSLENEMDEKGNKQRRIRDRYVHILTEICLHNNILDQDFTLDRWNHVQRRQSAGLQQENGEGSSAFTSSMLGAQTQS